MVTIGSAGILAPGSFLRPRAMAWMVLLAVGLLFFMTFFDRLVRRPFGEDPSDPIKLGASIIASVAVLALYRFTVGYAEKRQVPELALAPLPRDLSLGLAVGGGMLALIVGLQWAFGWVTIETREVDAIANALRDSIRSGVMEEVLMRLVIFRMFWRVLGVWPAFAIEAILFGIMHLPNAGSGMFAALCLTAGEGVFIALFLLTGRVWACIGAHAGWNFVQGWIFGAAVSGTDSIAGGPLATYPTTGVPAMLSGAEFGPEASAAALVVSLAGSAYALWLCWKRDAFRAVDDRPPASGSQTDQ